MFVYFVNATGHGKNNFLYLYLYLYLVNRISGINFGKILIEIPTFLFKKKRLQMSSE